MPANSNRRFALVHHIGPPTLIVLGSLWLLQSVFAHTGSHGVIIRNLNYDAGTVKAGSVVTDNVRLINLSSSPVEVDAQPGCGCTVADVPEKPLARCTAKSSSWKWIQMEWIKENKKKVSCYR